MQPSTIYVRVGLKIPTEYSAFLKPFFVPKLNAETMLSCVGIGSAIDITSIETPGFYKAVVVNVTYHIRMRDGREYWFGNTLMELGRNGGGWFNECVLNPVYDEPITFEEFEAHAAAEAAFDEPDYWY